MVNKEVVVKVENLKKTFHIPLEAHNGIKQKLINTIKGRKGYREFTPLNDISFEIEKGDFFGIVGRNGSGKSTLLKTLAGIYNPDGGAVHVNGTLVPFIELGVGFNPELTGRENVFLNGALLGFSRKQMESMYDDIVDFAELHDFMEERLKNYSSGMQVRLAFSIAIRADGDILLLDEVLAVGDEAFQRKCNEYFNTLKKKGKTVILVTHSMSDVNKFCNKAMMIQDGRIILRGNPEEVANEYSVENTKSINTVVAAKPEPRVENIIEKSVSDIDVKLLSKKVISEKDKIQVKVEYTINSDVSTKLYVNLIDINRNIPLYASSTDIGNKKNERVTRTFSIDISDLNDTSIQVAVSICDIKSGVCLYIPSDKLPTFLLRHTNYPNPEKKTTYATMFDRGVWLNDE